MKLVRSLLYLNCLRFSSFAAALISCRVFFSSSSLLTILIKFDFSSLLDLTELSCYRLFMFNLKAYPLISSSFCSMVFCNFAFSLVQEAISTRYSPICFSNYWACAPWDDFKLSHRENESASFFFISYSSFANLPMVSFLLLTISFENLYLY